MDIILIPGLWLHGDSWEAVVPPLEWAGHRVTAVTLPGLESADADRSGITLGDHVAAVVALVDSVDGDRPVMVVGHSMGCAIAHAVADARPDRVARVVHVGGFPLPDGAMLGGDDFASDGADVPMPDWDDFDEADLGGLDEQARTRFRDRAIPSPAGVVNSAQQLGDDRRYDVPVTMVCPEYGSSMLRDWVADGAAPVAELTRIRDVSYVDLPTGHWPQFTRPFDLARVLDSCTRQRSGDVIDLEGRIEPPLAGDEAENLFGFLEFQRSTFAWKCIGPDAAGLQVTVGVSSMTLGGLLKHMAYVEDHWFSHALHGNDRAEPFGSVDWTADSDWEWRSAAADGPAELATIWYDRVGRSRELAAEAMDDGGLDAPASRSGSRGTVSLRWIVTHMIEEYARHNGHADLIREAVDGSTGE